MPQCQPQAQHMMRVCVWVEQVWRHRIGTDPEADELVYHEEDEAFYMSLSRSRSNKLIFIDISALLLPMGYMPPALPHAFLRWEGPHLHPCLVEQR